MKTTKLWAVMAAATFLRLADVKAQTTTYSSSQAITQSANTGDYLIFGGTGYTDGAYLALPGDAWGGGGAQGQGEIFFTAGFTSASASTEGSESSSAFSIYNKACASCTTNGGASWRRDFNMSKGGVVNIGAPGYTGGAALLSVAGAAAIGNPGIYPPSNGLAVGGQVLIGTGLSASQTQTDGLLFVNGAIYAKKLKVEVPSSGVFADYVFDKDYKLTSLKELEKFINKNHHLPEIPTAAEVEKDGIDIADLDIKLLKKIEELTLYMIDMKEENDKQNLKIENLEKENSSLRKSLNK